MFPQPSYASLPLSLPSTTTPCPPPYASSRNTAKLARHHQLRSTSRSIRPPLPTRDYPAPPMDSSDQQLIGIAVVEEGRRCCVECRTTTTPMWRSGPTGPRSLCNACGIRYRKKRRRELGLDNKQQLLQQQQQGHHGEASSPVKDSNSSSSNKSSRLQVVKKRRVLMGVEEAAFLLMALSSSSTSTLLHGQESTPLVHNVHT